VILELEESMDSRRPRIASRPWQLLLFTLALSVIAGAQTFSVLHSFTGGQDGANPLAGVNMDRAGNLYGTASLGGRGFGTVYKLGRHGSGWILNPLYQFRGAPDGFYPEARVTIAPDGTLYGTTFYGGNSYVICLQGDTQTCGTVFHLTPPPTACSTVSCPWIETQIFLGNNLPGLHYFGPGDLIFDQMGNLYGTALQGSEQGNGGGVYELSPSGGGWSESLIAGFGLPGTGGAQPFGDVIMDSARNLYGTTGGAQGVSQFPYGTVFELSPSGSGWTQTVLHTFQNGNDGSFSKAGLVMDSAGNLYGTTSAAGAGNGGVVFELSPSQSGWTFNVLYSFPGPPGRGPFGPLLLDSAGNLYGTTLAGGSFQQGAVFKLTNSNGVWTYNSLHDFTNGSDGRSPYGHLLLDTSGNLYGTAGWGGSSGNGVVWEITP
jgi:uncharacterized repeat protein (TIGR03803 family)